MNQQNDQSRLSGRLLRMAVAVIALLALVPWTGNQVAAQGTATIVVTTYGEDGSTPLPFVRVQVTDSNGVVYGPLETPPSEAQVTFEVEAGDGTDFEVIVETPPACGTAPDPVVIENLAAGEEATVEFEVPVEDGCDLGALSAYTYICPDGFDTSATDYAAWRDGCWEPIDGHEIRFRSGDGSGEWIKTTGQHGIAGRAPLVGLYAGEYTIEDLDAEVTPVVYCLWFESSNPIEAPAPGTIEPMEVEDGAVRVGLGADERIACDFFYAAEGAAPSDDESDDDESSDEGPITSAESGTGMIEIHKAVCPAGYEPNPEIFNDCHGDGLEDVTFTITGPDDYEDSADTVIEESPGPGIVRFTELAAGTYTISEDVPDHDTTIFVYCSLANADDLVDFSYNDDGSIDLPLGDGVQVICDWYNIPIDASGETSSLFIRKLICPPGTTENYYETCFDDRLADVTFELDGPGDFTDSGVTNDDGEVYFPEVPAGDYRISEDIPGGGNDIFVYCAIIDGDRLPVEFNNQGGIDITIPGGAQVACDWYNIPEEQPEPANLTLQAFACPEGTSGDYAAQCTEPLQDVTFELGGDGSGSAVTDEDGETGFSDLAPGEYVVTELPPAGVNVAIYVVSCVADGASHPFTYDDSTGLRIVLELDSGDDVTCAWYNIPPSRPTPTPTPVEGGSITIFKYLCQGKESNEYDWFEECEAWGDGADFALLDRDGNELQTGTTDSDGKLVFSGLDDGSYGLDEISGDWCHAEADRVDSRGAVIVADGGNTDVFIFNCSAKKIDRLPATGVGEASGAPLGSLWLLAGAGFGVASLFALRQRLRLRVAR